MEIALLWNIIYHSQLRSYGGGMEDTPPILMASIDTA
jgi:hypothetical protein